MSSVSCLSTASERIVRQEENFCAVVILLLAMDRMPLRGATSQAGIEPATNALEVRCSIR